MKFISAQQGGFMYAIVTVKTVSAALVTQLAT